MLDFVDTKSLSSLKCKRHSRCCSSSSSSPLLVLDDVEMFGDTFQTKAGLHFDTVWMKSTKSLLNHEVIVEKHSRCCLRRRCHCCLTYGTYSPRNYRRALRAIAKKEDEWQKRQMNRHLELFAPSPKKRRMNRNVALLCVVCCLGPSRLLSVGDVGETPT